MSGRKYKAFKQYSKVEATKMDETAIAALLDSIGAARYEGDAAQLCAIAAHTGMDQAMLVWWLKVPASRLRDWSGAALRAWTLRYAALLSHTTTGDNIHMCRQCHSHPARLMGGVWICSSGNCPPLPDAPAAAQPSPQSPGPA